MAETCGSAQLAMRSELTESALQMALNQRQSTDPLVHHSDRGSQYRAEAYRSLLTI